MKKADAPKFIEYLSVLNEMYGNGKPMSDLKIEIYFKVLEELDIKEVYEAVTLLAKEKRMKVFPTPAEILNMARLSLEELANQSWEILLRVIQDYGYYDSVTFEDGAIGMTVHAMGGWIKCADWLVEERKWNRQEFIKQYIRYASQGEWSPMTFAGAHEVHNSAKGLREYIKPPVVIHKVETKKLGKQKETEVIALGKSRKGRLESGTDRD